MASVTYNGEEESVSVGGASFKKGESVEVNDQAILAKLFQNPFFEVSGYEPKPVTTTTTTVDNPNIDTSNQPGKEQANPNPTTIGTTEDLAAGAPSQTAEGPTGVYPDDRYKAPVQYAPNQDLRLGEDTMKQVQEGVEGNTEEREQAQKSSGEPTSSEQVNDGAASTEEGSLATSPGPATDAEMTTAARSTPARAAKRRY